VIEIVVTVHRQVERVEENPPLLYSGGLHELYIRMYRIPAKVYCNMRDFLNRLHHSPCHLKTETDPGSETLWNF
jgi:hypothetical protein